MGFGPSTGVWDRTSGHILKEVWLSLLLQPAIFFFLSSDVLQLLTDTFFILNKGSQEPIIKMS